MDWHAKLAEIKEQAAQLENEISCIGSEIKAYQARQNEAIAQLNFVRGRIAAYMEVASMEGSTNGATQTTPQETIDIE